MSAEPSTPLSFDAWWKSEDHQFQCEAIGLDWEEIHLRRKWAEAGWHARDAELDRRTAAAQEAVAEPSAPLSAEDLEEIRERHYRIHATRFDGRLHEETYCAACDTEWPCETVCLLQEIAQLQEDRGRLRGIVADCKWLVKMADVLNDEEWDRVTKLTARIEGALDAIR